MYCKQCGSYLEPDALTCPVCGAPAPEPAQLEEPVGQPIERTEHPSGAPEQHSASWEFGAGVTGGPATPPPPPTYSEPCYQRPAPPAPDPDVDEPEPPVKTLEWLWSLILTAIPIVNLVVLLIWSFGAGTSTSKRNWARAKLILVAVSTVLSVIAIIVLLGGMIYATGYSHAFGYSYEPYYYY